MALSPTELSLRARLGAHAQHAAGKTNTGPARRAFDQRFYDQVDPDRQLPPAERERRAAHARKAYFTQLSLKAATARRKASQ